MPAQEEALNALAAEVTESICSKKGNAYSPESASALLGLLAAFTESSNHGSGQYASAAARLSNQPSGISHTSPADMQHSSARAQPSARSSTGAFSAQGIDKTLNGASGEDTGASRQSQTWEGTDGERVEKPASVWSGKSYAAGAVVQAALNAIAAAGNGVDPMGASSPVIAPTSSAAAAVAVQVSPSLLVHAA